MYGLQEYGNMLRDRVRTKAYRAAIDQSLHPDSVVLDLGAGTGAFALYAAVKGARKVYAVETSPLIDYGRREAERLGLGDRIEFFHGKSEDFSPAERANLLISDLRGALPFLGDAHAVLADARKRLLTADAIILPQRDHLFVAPVQDPRWYEKQVEMPWALNALDLEMPLLREAEGSTPRRPPPTGLQAALPGQCFGVLDYRSDVQLPAPAKLKWQSTEAKTIHAYLLWFDAEIADGVSMSAAPGAEAPVVYGRLVLPLVEPLVLQPGGELELELRVWPVANDFAYTWNSMVRGADGQVRTTLRQHSAQEMFLAARISGK